MSYLHQLQQLLAQVCIVGQEDGLALGVNACPTRTASHLSVLCGTQDTVLGLNALVVMPAIGRTNSGYIAHQGGLLHAGHFPWC